MKISILLSTYKSEKYIEPLLNSLCHLEGDYKLFLLIRNDGPDSELKQILKKYVSSLNIKYYEGRNLGPRDSFMELVSMAPDSDYYAFCDQDDIWYSDKLIRALAMMEPENGTPALYFSNVDYIDQKGQSLNHTRYDQIPGITLQELFVSNPALGCTIVYNRKLQEIIKCISAEHFFMHDVVAILAAATFGKIIYDENSTIAYRQHTESVTQGRAFFKNIRNKLDFWFVQRQINIASQARELLEIASEKNIELDEDKRRILSRIENYKRGVKRVALARDKEYRVNSRNCDRSFVIRVLLGLA